MYSLSGIILDSFNMIGVKQRRGHEWSGWTV